MKRTAGFAVAGLVLALALSLASAHPDGARPEGVAADAWIPLTAEAGFVVTGANSQLTRLGAQPTVTGYLMARRKGKWVRLEPEAAGHVMPAR